MVSKLFLFNQMNSANFKDPQCLAEACWLSPVLMFSVSCALIWSRILWRYPIPSIPISWRLSWSIFGRKSKATPAFWNLILNSFSFFSEKLHWHKICSTAGASAVNVLSLFASTWKPSDVSFLIAFKIFLWLSTFLTPAMSSHLESNLESRLREKPSLRNRSSNSWRPAASNLSRLCPSEEQSLRQW